MLWWGVSYDWKERSVRKSPDFKFLAFFFLQVCWGPEITLCFTILISNEIMWSWSNSSFQRSPVSLSTQNKTIFKVRWGCFSASSRWIWNIVKDGDCTASWTTCSCPAIFSVEAVLVFIAARCSYCPLPASERRITHHCNNPFGLKTTATGKMGMYARKRIWKCLDKSRSHAPLDVL